MHFPNTPTACSARIAGSQWTPSTVSAGAAARWGSLGASQSPKWSTRPTRHVSRWAHEPIQTLPSIPHYPEREVIGVRGSSVQSAPERIQREFDIRWAGVFGGFHLPRAIGGLP